MCIKTKQKTLGNKEKIIIQDSEKEVTPGNYLQNKLKENFRT